MVPRRFGFRVSNLEVGIIINSIDNEMEMGIAIYRACNVESSILIKITALSSYMLIVYCAPKPAPLDKS